MFSSLDWGEQEGEKRKNILGVLRGGAARLESRPGTVISHPEQLILRPWSGAYNPGGVF